MIACAQVGAKHFTVLCEATERGESHKFSLRIDNTGELTSDYEGDIEITRWPSKREAQFQA